MNFTGLLGSMIGGRGGSQLGRMVGGSTGGMVGGMLGAMLGGGGLRKMTGGGRGGGGLAGALSGLTGGGDQQEAEAAPAAEISEADAEVLIKVMCNAAKADGEVSQDELAKILGELGDLDAEESAHLKAELGSPLTAPEALAAAVPPALLAEAYVVSLAAIDVDTDAEANYLRSFATALGIDADSANKLHGEVGIAPIFN